MKISRIIPYSKRYDIKKEPQQTGRKSEDTILSRPCPLVGEPHRMVITVVVFPQKSRV